MSRQDLLEETQNAYGKRVSERVCFSSWRRVELRTGSDGFGPQLIVLELMQIGLCEATSLDGLERH